MIIGLNIYPKPKGTEYTEEDIKTLEDVEKLFDYCQILEAVITKEGWDYLINTFGMESLYQVEQKSEWFGSESFDEFVRDVENEKEISITRRTE